ncbi:hypothetical protein BC830DRAFT_1175769 [Chytriomyces sp. MP71]|nr:hypothetical protein BC830DRAFT_1175769 [Chytriomyces sp. MP71]
MKFELISVDWIVWRWQARRICVGEIAMHPLVLLDFQMQGINHYNDGDRPTRARVLVNNTQLSIFGHLRNVGRPIPPWESKLILHEIGHVHGVGHSVDGLMNRGMDDRIVSVFQAGDYEDQDETDSNEGDSDNNDGKLEPFMSDGQRQRDGSSGYSQQAGGLWWRLLAPCKLPRIAQINPDAIPCAQVTPPIRFRSDIFGPVGKQEPFGTRMPRKVVAFLVPTGASV